MRWFAISFSLLSLATIGTAYAGDSQTEARPTPLTRPEMKRMLEEMKQRTPRIPLPEPTEEEQAQTEDRSRGYESRLRTLYLPEGDSRGGLSFSSGPGQPPRTPPGDRRPQDPPDPSITLDYKFKTALFWIASRGNNCQYCLGHQESKLLSAGMVEDEIAALDSDWSQFTPGEQAAFSLARRLTLEPHRLADADIDAVRNHYTDLQILEMVLSVAGNNSINRWKEGTGVPQSSGGGGFGRRSDAASTAEREEHSYLTPTSKEFQAKPSIVAAVSPKSSVDPSACETICARPPLESRDETEKALEAAEQRRPRLPVVDESKAREVLGEVAPDGTLPNWARLLANFPIAGKRSVAGIRTADEKGDLSPLVKAQLSWIIARQDRAWYALGQAKRRLRELGQSDDQIYALDGDWASQSERNRALFTVARHLAASPVVLTDKEVASAVEYAGPRDTVQMITYTTNRASFNRFTEAAGLPIEN